MRGTVSSLMPAGFEPRRFFAWWVGELAALADARAGAHAPWRAMLLRRPEGFEALLRKGDGTVPIGRIDVGAENRDGIRAIVAQLLRSGVSPDTFVLRLAPDDVVTVREVWPAGIRDYLDRAVENQLEIKAPWPAGRALYAWRVAETMPGPPERIAVDIWIAGKALVDPVLQAFAAEGLAPGIVDFGSGTDEPVLNLAVREGAGRAAREHTIGKVVRVVGLASLAAAVLASGFAAWAAWDRAKAEAELADAVRAAAAVSRPRTVLDPGLQRQAIEQRRTAPSVATMMETLSRVLPPTANLERLELRDGVLTISGKAANVPSLIGVLEASSLLRDVQFAAPTTRAEGEARDAFSISAHVGAAASQSARQGRP